MPPPALSVVYCDDSDVQALLSALAVTLRLDDDGDGALSAGESAFLLRAHSWATSRVRFYTNGIYDAAALASSYLVNEWATVLSAYYVCTRRCNPVPDSVRELAFGEDGRGGVIGDLKEVRAGVAQIPDVGARSPSSPAWSNVSVDPRFRVRQIRVQQPTSERTPPKTYSPAADWRSSGVWEF